MDFISDEFILARTGEPLEARIRENDKFQQRMKSLHVASQAFSKGSDLSKKCWKLYDTLENEWTKYKISCMGKNLIVWGLRMVCR